VSYLSEIRAALAHDKPDLSKIGIKEISYALTDIIGQAREARWRNREEANRLQAEIPRIFQLKAMKFAQLGHDALADEMQKVRKKMRDPDRINIYDQTYLDCLIEAEKTLPDD
jgi:hypothetical protein